MNGIDSVEELRRDFREQGSVLLEWSVESEAFTVENAGSIRIDDAAKSVAASDPHVEIHGRNPSSFLRTSARGILTDESTLTLDDIVGPSASILVAETSERIRPRTKVSFLLDTDSPRTQTVEITDLSAGGVGCKVDDTRFLSRGQRVRVEPKEVPELDAPLYGRVAHLQEDSTDGASRLGIELDPLPLEVADAYFRTLNALGSEESLSVSAPSDRCEEFLSLAADSNSLQLFTEVQISEATGDEAHSLRLDEPLHGDTVLEKTRFARLEPGEEAREPWVAKVNSGEANHLKVELAAPASERTAETETRGTGHRVPAPDVCSIQVRREDRNKSFEVQPLDVSLGGVGFLLDEGQTLRRDDRVEITLDIPDQFAEVLPGCVAHVHRSGSEDLARVGVAFTRLTAGERKRLNRALGQLESGGFYRRAILYGLLIIAFFAALLLMGPLVTPVSKEPEPKSDAKDTPERKTDAARDASPH